MSIRWITGDVFDGLAELEDGSIDVVITSPPFLALRSYLPADHPDKAKEIGSETTPAEFIDTLLSVTAELRRVLAPHGSIAIELGDTYAGSGGAGGDYNEDGLREGQPKFRQAGARGGGQGHMEHRKQDEQFWTIQPGGPGWPLAKSRALIPQLYEIALAYGINPLTGTESPAGQWRIRNVVTWARPNPPVGALGDKWRPATSDVVVACVSPKRYWDDLATRRHPKSGEPGEVLAASRAIMGYRGDPNAKSDQPQTVSHIGGAPLLDYWEIPPGGYKGSHYAVFPEELVVPLVKAMCPEKVCRVCGEPSRRIHQASGGLGQVIEHARTRAGFTQKQVAEWFPSASGGITGCVWNWENETNVPMPDQWALLKDRLNIGDEWDHLLPDRDAVSHTLVSESPSGWTQDAKGRVYQRLPARMDRHVKEGWTDCGHDNYRPGLVLDPFAGSGTTLAVASGHGHDAIGIDLDPRNEDLARERIGPLLFEVLT